MSLLVDKSGKITTQAVRVHIVIEEKAVVPEQILDAVLRSHKQCIEARLLHQTIQSLCVERRFVQSRLIFDRVSFGIGKAHFYLLVCGFSSPVLSTLSRGVYT